MPNVLKDGRRAFGLRLRPETIEALHGLALELGEEARARNPPCLPLGISRVADLALEAGIELMLAGVRERRGHAD